MFLLYALLCARVFAIKSHRLVSVLPNGTLQLHNPDILLELAPNDEEAAIVSMVGPWRTGKSYLLNEIIGQQQDTEEFEVGHDTVPATEGLVIKLYKTKEPDGSSKRIIFMDTAGLQCPYRSEQGDARVMALASLMSSILIYNHPGVLNDHEIKRFNFIVSLAHAVPSSVDGEHGIDKDFLEFRPHLFWVMRDNYLRLTDIEHQEITPTELVELNLNRNARGVMRFFRTVTGFAMPYPTDDMNRVKELPENPGIRNTAWKSAIANIRGAVYSTAQAKRLKDNLPRMKGKDLRDLLVTFVRRLNSDSGIAELDTMKSLIDSLHGQKLGNAVQLYNATLTGHEPPIPLSMLEEINQNATEKAETSLREALDSYPQEELHENLATLRDKLSSLYDQYKKDNSLEIMRFSKAVIEEEVHNYRENWDKFKMPEEVQALEYHHTALEEAGHKNIQQRLGDMLGATELLREKKVMTGLLKTELEAKLKSNEQLSIQACNQMIDFFSDQLEDKINKYYWVMEDLLDDLKRWEADFEVKCKGPGKVGKDQMDSKPYIEKLEKVLQDRKLTYSHTFFAFFVFNLSFSGLWVADLFDNQPYAFALCLSGFLWVVTFISNQLVQSLGPMWYVQSLAYHVQYVFVGSVSAVVATGSFCSSIIINHLDLFIGISTGILLLSSCFLFWKWLRRKGKRKLL